MATPDYFGTDAAYGAATRVGTAQGYANLGYPAPRRAVAPNADPEDYFSPVADDYGAPAPTGRAPRAAAVVDPFDVQFKQAKSARQHLLDQEALYAHRLKDFDATEGAPLKMGKNPATGQRDAIGFRDETQPLVDSRNKLLETLGDNAGTAALNAPTTPRERALRQTRQRIADELARVQRARMDFDTATYAPLTAKRAARDAAPAPSSLLSSNGGNVEGLDFLSGINQDANTRQALGLNQRGSVGAGNFTQSPEDSSTPTPPLSSEEQPYDAASHDEQPRDYFGEDSATLLQQQTGTQPTPTEQQRFAQAGVLDRLKMMGSKLFGGGEGIRTPESEVSVPAGIPIGFGDAGTTGQVFDVPATEGTGVVSGLARAGNKFTASLLTPENAAIAAATGGLGELAAAGGAIGKAAQLGKTAALGGFASDMASNVPQQVKDAYAVYNDPNSTAAQKAEAIATPGLTAFMAGLAAHGAVGEARRVGDIGEMRAANGEPAISPETQPSTGENHRALPIEPAREMGVRDPSAVREEMGGANGSEVTPQASEPTPPAEIQAEAPAERLSGGSPLETNPVVESQTPTASGKPLPPEWQITVQEPQGDIPGFQQVDKIGQDGDSQGSVSLEDLKAEGYAVPDVSHLKQGQYRFGELPEAPANAELTQPTPSREPAPAPVEETRAEGALTPQHQGELIPDRNPENMRERDRYAQGVANGMTRQQIHDIDMQRDAVVTARIDSLPDGTQIRLKASPGESKGRLVQKTRRGWDRINEHLEERSLGERTPYSPLSPSAWDGATILTAHETPTPIQYLKPKRSDFASIPEYHAALVKFNLDQKFRANRIAELERAQARYLPAETTARSEQSGETREVPGEPAPAAPANEPIAATEPVAAEPAPISSETQTPETAQLGENQNGPNSSKRLDAQNIEPVSGIDSRSGLSPRPGEPADLGPNGAGSGEQPRSGAPASDVAGTGRDRTVHPDNGGPRDASSPLTDEPTTPAAPGDAVGIKNASVEDQRTAQGIEPADLRRGIKNQDALDSAMAERARDPGAGKKLINDFESNPRALTADENALLATELNRIRVERNAAKAEADTALAAGDQSGVEAAQQRIAALREEFNRAGAVADATGTRQSDALRTRQMMLNEDYSLAELERQQTIANRGEPITPKQQQEIESLHATYQEKLKAYETQLAQHSDRIGRLEAERAAQDLLQRTAPERTTARKAPPGRVRQYIEDQAKAAEARIMERRRQGKTYSGIDPTELKDYAFVAAKYVARGLDAATELVKTFGEVIRPHVKAILDEAARVAKEAEGERDTASERAATVEALKARASDGGSVSDSARYVRKVAEQHVREGITAREPLVDAVHATVKEAFPDATRREVMDAMSGYGNFSELNKDPVAVTLRDINGQLQNLSKLEDMQAGRAPSKTGVERRTPSGEERRLIQQVNEAKKKGGFTVQDPERQLKTAQDAIKTRLRHEIEDLDFQIATGKKTVKERTSPQLDAEATALRERRDALKKIYDEKFPKAELTDAERNQRAIQAADAQIAELEQQIKSGDVGTGLPGAKPAPSPELAARQAKLSALRAERDVLRDTDQHISQLRSDAALEKEAQTLREQIAAKEAKIQTGDVEPSKRAVDRPADPRIEQLKQQRDAATKRLADARKAKNEAAAGFQSRELKRLNEAITERQAKLDAGDLSSNARPAAQNRPLPPELEAAKQKLEAINRQIADARDAAKPRKTAEEIQLSAYRAALERRRAALLEREARQARGDFSAPPKRQPIELPPDLQTAKADLERAKQALDERQKAEELKNRPAWQKGLDLVSKWTRGAVLSSPVTLAKLLSASVNQVALHPLDEMAGSVYSKLVPKVSAKAQIEGGGFSGKATAKSLAAGLVKGWGDLKDTLSKSKGNRSELDALYGKGHAAPEALEFFGLLHGAEKAPLKRYAFTYALEKQIAYAQAHGIDITNPAAQVRMGAEAYKYSNRMIFQEDNWVSNAFNRGLTSLAEPSKETGRIPVAKKLAETAVRVSLPVAKVGTNIALQSFERVFGSVQGGVELARAYAKGIENLKPAEAEIIMRHLKRGTPGLALAAAAYFMPGVIQQVFGGFYDKTEKRDKRDVAPGEMKSPVALPKFVSKTGNIPAYLLHNPAINAAHFYSTAARAGIPHALLGLAEETPYVRELKDVVGATEPGRASNYLGGVANSMNPQLVQFAARQMDRNSEGDVTTRKPSGFVQTVEQGIPGLRGNVPQKTYVDPAVEGAINRLGVDIPIPARPKIGPPNKKVPVSDDAYLRYRQEADRALNRLLLANLPTLRGLPKEQADRRVKELATQAHAQAHVALPTR